MVQSNAYNKRAIQIGTTKKEWLLENIQELFQNTPREILCCIYIKEFPKLNKLWEIEIFFLHSSLRVGPLVLGNLLKCVIACHIRGDFTAYSVRIGNSEFWYDRLEDALGVISRSLNIPRHFALYSSQFYWLKEDSGRNCHVE